MLEPGLTGQSNCLVGPQDLASAYGNPGADVVATMVVATLLEQASLKAIQDYLSPDEICVGSRLDFRHLAPTPPGFTVTAQAKLVEVDRRRLVFEVWASDETQEVARGIHERFILDNAKFQAQVAAKKAQGPGQK
ncbi:MAG: thioesterase family protein [Deltaproteobacteria bacterium]|nr:thioesterase family protein [Deltaproteobacteria bacterium]